MSATAPLRRRLVAGVTAALTATGLMVVAVAWMARPAEPTGYGPRLEGRFVDACTRAGAGEGRCRCAYERLRDAMPFEQFRELDADVARGGQLAPAVRVALGAC